MFIGYVCRRNFRGENSQIYSADVNVTIRFPRGNILVNLCIGLIFVFPRLSTVGLYILFLFCIGVLWLDTVLCIFGVTR